MPDSPRWRAAQLAKVAADLTWWLGLALCAALVIVFLGAPLVERAGLRATFAWNAFHIDGGRGGARSSVRIVLPDSVRDVRVIERQAVRVTDDREVTVDVAVRRWSVFYSANSFSVIMMLATLGMICVVRTFLATVVRDQVFTLANARRLSTLGWLLLATGLGGPQLERFRGALIVSEINSAAPGSFSLADTHGNPTWMLGVLVLVIAAAWRHGVDLQTDHDSTI